MLHLIKSKLSQNSSHCFVYPGRSVGARKMRCFWSVTSELVLSFKSRTVTFDAVVQVVSALFRVSNLMFLANVDFLRYQWLIIAYSQWFKWGSWYYAYTHYYLEYVERKRKRLDSVLWSYVSITQLLRTDLGRSVRISTALQLCDWTSLQDPNLLTNLKDV